MEKIILELNPENQENFSNNSINLNEIQKISTQFLNYEEFYRKFMKFNLPILIENSSNQWKCKYEWIHQNKINFNFLKNKFGFNVKVPISNCSKRYFDSHEKIEMTLLDFLNYWQAKIEKEENRFYNRDGICSASDDISSSSSAGHSNSSHSGCGFNNSSRNDITTTNDTEPILYLKDWHLKAFLPDYDFYAVPKYFASDWLNEYLIDNGRDDYRFCYFGPRGSWTPFHSDVFGSFSWSTNIYGQKKWLLLPPGEELKLTDFLGNLPFSIDEELLQKMNCKYYKLIQNENESLFVPSMWYHQVENLTDTISINHNWFNACNIEIIWRKLSENMQKVQKEIQDCSDMENFREHCQLMLKCSFGINYYDFLDILEHVKKKSLMIIFNQSSDIQNDYELKFNLYKLNSQHYYEDLRAIFRLCQKMKTDFIIRDDIELLNRVLHLENETNLFDGLF